ncbi:MAG: hypothetical protein K9K84_08625 [Methylovulum sp.]|jgi:hypothetical protein|nr:hypothetical protein [Methylovulum sp.]
MKKSKKRQNSIDKAVQTVIRNPVAKFAHHTNKTTFFRDKTKYCRQGKHQGQEAWLMIFIKIISQACCA